ncbi:ACT domain-containing protein [Mycetocola zhadangensis]|uniref:ACT domain-containing protein n=1 Tax=Mycetocola zhadangensis TaxID=1164595 RepID=A0A3L7J3I7_9MICO|nr:ACT domain-containing protein [Mycetocola zhadangensis]RLQ84001.1 ACT domain-containing protein [Mycetocola zhadangensis]GGE96970.1 ACT domain-containing protein [Mycetocola zhadangensis]
MPTPSVELHPLTGDYVIARLPASAQVPDELLRHSPGDGYVSITRTPQELSIVCLSEQAPASAKIDGTWKALYASGPIPFGLTGVVTSLVAPLSAAGCAVFVTSTFDGDVLMVQSADSDRARTLLKEAGHTFTSASDVRTPTR